MNFSRSLSAPVAPFFLVALLALGWASALPAAPDFEEDVRLLLEVNCVSCHHPEKAKGDLQIHNREAALKGGESGSRHRSRKTRRKRTLHPRRPPPRP